MTLDDRLFLIEMCLDWSTEYLEGYVLDDHHAKFYKCPLHPTLKTDADSRISFIKRTLKFDILSTKCAYSKKLKRFKEEFL
jgi:hypothetical protein